MYQGVVVCLQYLFTGCCPLDHAVCCDDRLHCCPQGTKCEMDKGACVSNNGNRANSTSIPINLTDFLYNL